VINLTLPYPPTVNTYWRSVKGRVLISKNGREYRKRVIGIVGNDIITILRPISVDIRAFMPDHRRRDLDNILKALLDSITHSKLIADDSQIDILRIERAGYDKTGGRVELTIQVIHVI